MRLDKVSQLVLNYTTLLLHICYKLISVSLKCSLLTFKEEKTEETWEIGHEMQRDFS